MLTNDELLNLPDMSYENYEKLLPIFESKIISLGIKSSKIEYFHEMLRIYFADDMNYTKFIDFQYSNDEFEEFQDKCFREYGMFSVIGVKETNNTVCANIGDFVFIDSEHDIGDERTVAFVTSVKEDGGKKIFGYHDIYFDFFGMFSSDYFKRGYLVDNNENFRDGFAEVISPEHAKDILYKQLDCRHKEAVEDLERSRLINQYKIDEHLELMANKKVVTIIKQQLKLSSDADFLPRDLTQT